MDNNKKNQQWIITQEGLLELSTSILEVVNQRIKSVIVTEINADSDDDHVPSARAVYDAINDISNNISTTPNISTRIVRGDIDDVPMEERTDKTIYIQTDGEDNWWSIYFWNIEDAEWIWVGDRQIDLSNYWTKSEEDLAELRQCLGIDELAEIIENLEVGAVSNIDAISDEDLERIILQAITDSYGEDDPIAPGPEEQDPNNADPDDPDPENPDDIMG